MIGLLTYLFRLLCMRYPNGSTNCSFPLSFHTHTHTHSLIYTYILSLSFSLSLTLSLSLSLSLPPLLSFPLYIQWVAGSWHPVIASLKSFLLSNARIVVRTCRSANLASTFVPICLLFHLCQCFLYAKVHIIILSLYASNCNVSIVPGIGVCVFHQSSNTRKRLINVLQ